LVGGREGGEERDCGVDSEEGREGKGDVMCGDREIGCGTMRRQVLTRKRKSKISGWV
jgi:hypothetical protein